MRWLRGLFFAVLTTCFAFALVGCNQPIEDDKSSSSSESYENVSAGPMNCVIIYSKHANSKASTTGMAEYIRGTKEANGLLGYVRLDGSPSIVYEEQTTTEHNNETRIKKENDEFVANKMPDLEDLTAASAEVDVLGAVEAANECLERAKDSSLDNVVVIIGTGLSTAGAVNFSSVDYANLDLSDYASWVESSGQLSRLEHVDKIIWYGFDQVESPQADFPTPRREESLKDFYVKIFKSAGVEEVEFKSGVESGSGSTGDLPPVSLVNMPERPKYGVGDATEVSSDVLFNGDESTFLNGTDPKENSDVIAIANSIKENELKVKITGYTAHYDTGSHGGVEELSLARAEALKNVLVEMGCPAERITTVGGGWGPYDDDQANRCVQFAFE